MSKVIVAAVQLDTQEDEEQAWQQVAELSRAGASRGAQVIAMPENMLYDGRETTRKHKLDVWLPRFQELARELSASMVFGSLHEPTEDDSKTHSYNTSFAIDAEGEIRGRYRKIHLFDVEIPNGPRYCESSYMRAGSERTSCELPPLGTVGLTICYDLRFPELYRKLVADGARTFFVPASFAMETGRDHWVTLLRARAIENQCFVVAPNQCGVKGGKNKKYGRSVIIGPWGDVLAQAPDRPSVITAELDFDALASLRSSLPVHDHKVLD